MKTTRFRTQVVHIIGFYRCIQGALNNMPVSYLLIVMGAFSFVLVSLAGINFSNSQDWGNSAGDIMLMSFDSSDSSDSSGDSGSSCSGSSDSSGCGGCSRGD